MPTLTAKFVEWASTDHPALCALVDPHEIAGYAVRNKAVLVGSTRQVRASLDKFFAGPAQAALHSAGYRNGGVEISRGCRSPSVQLFDEFLAAGHPHVPAMAWVSPVTSSLSGHAGGRGPTCMSGTKFGISPDEERLFLPLGGKPGLSLRVRPASFPWVGGHRGSLAIIPRLYDGNGFLSERTQYTIAPFADCDEHKKFIGETDLVLAHDGAIVQGGTAAMWHSLHPLMGVGRLRPCAGEQHREFPSRAVLDYVVVVLDAQHPCVVSISRLSVAFEQWIRPEVCGAICGVFAPGLAATAAEEREKAALLERSRRLLLSEIKGWRHAYATCPQFRVGIRQEVDRVMDAARALPGWPRPRGGLMDRDEAQRCLDSLEYFVETADGCEGYLELAERFLDVEERMTDYREALGFPCADS